MRRLGAPDQIESLGSVLRDLLDLHFPTLRLGQVVPTSFARQQYEAELVDSEQGRTAWLTVTEEDLHRVSAGDSSGIHESPARFSRSVSFKK